MGLIKGLLYCSFWYLSILAGYAGLFCPLLPILFVSNKWYRFCTDALFTFWQYYPTVLLETLCGCEIQISGDAIRTSETSLIIMNHRTRTDWNFLWPTMYHAIVGGGRFKYPTKFVLKDIIRHIPGPGWVMQLACFLFVKRCWVLDKTTLEKVVRYFSDLSYKYSLLVFPEGTDFTSSTKAKSNQYAIKHGLPQYNHVLHPRTRGFVYLTKQLLDRDALDAVYDVTLIYPDQVPQTEIRLLRGDFPKQIKVHLARFPKDILPRSEPGLKAFLEKRWLEKENTLKEYSATGRFLHGNILRTERPLELFCALFFWSCLPFVVIYVLFVSKWYRLIVLAHTFFLIFINYTRNGFQNFEINLYNIKNAIFFHCVTNVK